MWSSSATGSSGMTYDHSFGSFSDSMSGRRVTVAARIAASDEIAKSGSTE